MRLIVDQLLATGFISINTRQQRASMPFKPGVLERKVYLSDDNTFFSVLTFAKPLCDNVLQPSSLHCSRCNTLSRAWVSLWNFETIRGSLMTPRWQKLASLVQEICILWFQFFGAVFDSKVYHFKNIGGKR